MDLLAKIKESLLTVCDGKTKTVSSFWLFVVWKARSRKSGLVRVKKVGLLGSVRKNGLRRSGVVRAKKLSLLATR